MIFDSDVLIWTLRGNEKAINLVEQDDERAISVITKMELLKGARDKREMAHIKQFFLSFKILPLSEEIGYRASLYIEQYVLKIKMETLDSLIAATAVELHLPLVTGNLKHYRQIDGLELRPFRG